MGFDCLTSIFSHLKWVSYIYFYVLKRIYSRIYCEYVYKIVKGCERIFSFVKSLCSFIQIDPTPIMMMIPWFYDWLEAIAFIMYLSIFSTWTTTWMISLPSTFLSMIYIRVFINCNHYKLKNWSLMIIISCLIVTDIYTNLGLCSFSVKQNVGKFRPQLIELTSFKSKLLIRFIMNKPCYNKQTSISCQNHAQRNSK